MIGGQAELNCINSRLDDVARAVADRGGADDSPRFSFGHDLDKAARVAVDQRAGHC